MCMAVTDSFRKERVRNRVRSERLGVRSFSRWKPGALHRAKKILGRWPSVSKHYKIKAFRDSVTRSIKIYGLYILIYIIHSQILRNSCHALYSFFEPRHARRSTFIIHYLLFSILYLFLQLLPPNPQFLTAFVFLLSNPPKHAPHSCACIHFFRPAESAIMYVYKVSETVGTPPVRFRCKQNRRIPPHGYSLFLQSA